jgi:regulator of sigma E protease
MAILQNIWWLMVLIGIMILIHELGHYWAARYFDVRVESFSIGFGPRLFGFRHGETDFRISLIPLGGYVKMEGEQPTDAATEDPRAFLNKPRWQRLIVAFAGPWMNIVLAVALLTGLYMYQFPKPVTGGAEGVIDVIRAGSAAAKAGFQSGDRVTAIDGLQDPAWEDIALKVLSSPGRPLRVTFERNGQEREATLTPETDARDGVGLAGWSEQQEFQVEGFPPGSDARRAGLRTGDILVAANGEPVRSVSKLRDVTRSSEGKSIAITYSRQGKQGVADVKPTHGEIDGKESWILGVQLGPRVDYVPLPLASAFRESMTTNLKGAGMIYGVLKNIVVQRMSAKSLEGPIRIAQASGDAAREGATSFVSLMAAVSLNLALFNLLPIPVLDGGMILLLLVEMVWRRDLSLQVKENVMKFGFVFLMMLVIFVLYNDIRKTIGG